MRYVMCFLLMNRCNKVEGDGVELYDIKSEFKGCLFMNLCVGKRTLSRGERLLLTGLHWLVLIASAALVAWITRDTLQGNVFILSRNYMRFQFGVCLLFQLDILVLCTKKMELYLQAFVFHTYKHSVSQSCRDGRYPPVIDSFLFPVFSAYGQSSFCACDDYGRAD